MPRERDEVNGVFVFPVKQTQSESPCLNGFQSDGDNDPFHNHETIITPSWTYLRKRCKDNLDGLGGTGVAHIHNIIHMITQRHKQIKEKFPPTFHLQLHGSAPLKRLATSDDQR